MEEIKPSDLAIVELEKALKFANTHLSLYQRMTLIAQFGVENLDEEKLLIAALKDRWE